MTIQVTVAANQETKIKSLPIELAIMIMKRLRLKDAINFAHALHIPEKVAAQYCDYKLGDFWNIQRQLTPTSIKFLFKNKKFQIESTSNEEIRAAIRTFDLDFVKKYLQDFEPDLDNVLQHAADVGFTDAVKLLLTDYRVDPSANDNDALCWAAKRGNVGIVKLLLEDSRVDPSAQNNKAIFSAADEGYKEMVRMLLSDIRVTSAHNNYLEVEIMKFLRSYRPLRRG